MLAGKFTSDSTPETKNERKKKESGIKAHAYESSYFRARGCDPENSGGLQVETTNDINVKITLFKAPT